MTDLSSGVILAHRRCEDRSVPAREVDLEVRVHGARGSTPVSGPAFERYGGSTTCFEVVLPDGHRLIVDGGSGLTHVQASLGAPGDEEEPFEATLLLTHFHWDHIQGLPFFPPMFAAASKIRIVAVPPPGFTVETALDGAIRPPWFPVRLSDAAATLTFEVFGSEGIHAGVAQVTGVSLNHPGGVTGYRIALDGRSLVIATDFQAGEAACDEAIRKLADGANVLLHDAQYTPSEWTSVRKNWGHSTWEHAVAVAEDAGVDRLYLTSHDPRRTDDAMDTIVSAARERFAAAGAAYEAQLIEV